MDEREKGVLSQIRQYLRAGHSLDSLKEAGWGAWITYLEDEGYDLKTSELEERGAANEAMVGEASSTWYTDERGRRRGFRRGLGMFLMTSGGILQIIFMVLLVGGAATGIWWPLTLAIIDNPVSVLWFVPLGFLFTGISFGIARFVYDLVIGMPMAMLTTWLLGDEL